MEWIRRIQRWWRGHGANVGNYFAGYLANFRPPWRNLPNAKAPDFDASLNALIATFAVLVGVSITDFFDRTKAPIDGKLFGPLFVMFIALLLRYIVGSAIHLKYTYGNPEQADGTHGPPRSRSVPLFFKDAAFLVLFGALAVTMTHSWERRVIDPNVAFGIVPFLQHCEWFLWAGLVWSLTDPILRWFYWYKGRWEEWPTKPFWLPWVLFDGLQLLLTWVVPLCALSPLKTVQILALIYVFFLFIDFGYLIRALRI
jgi:hypothetical protein